MKKNKEQDEQVLKENDIAKKHSFVCNDELFMKDLIAIVDDTMGVEEDLNN